MDVEINRGLLIGGLLIRGLLIRGGLLIEGGVEVLIMDVEINRGVSVWCVASY